MRFSTFALEAALLSVALARPYGHGYDEGLEAGSDFTSYKHASGWAHHSSSPTYDASSLMLGVHPTGSKQSNWTYNNALSGSIKSVKSTDGMPTITLTSTFTHTATIAPAASADGWVPSSGMALPSDRPDFNASELMMGVHSTDSESYNPARLRLRGWPHGWRHSDITTTSTSTMTISSTTTITPSPSVSVATAVEETTSTEMTSTPTKATTATSSTAASTTGKRGLSYNAASLCSGFDGSSEVSWAYNWGSSSSGLNGFEYVPMLWGLSSSWTSDWASAVSSALDSGSSHLLSFNEPDLSSQANLSPSDAAAGYATYMQPYAPSAKLGSPAVTNGGSPMGLTWLGEFFSACTSCTINFVPIHWYSSASNVDYFKSYIAEAYAAGGNRPLWITEFAASGTADEQNSFLEAVLPWLDSTDMVERYAYFMTAAGTLVNSDGTLTTLGQTYSS